jgi:hypothetical protein
MSSEKDTVRFGVGSPTRERSSVWRLWVTPNSNDIYLAPRVSAHEFKASLHQSGVWRIGVTKEHQESDWSLIGPDQDRAMRKWARPPELIPGLTTAFHVVVPWSEVALPSHRRPEKRGRVFWAPIPPPGRVAVFSVLISTPSAVVTGWPGKKSMGTSLVGKLGLPNGDTVWVVAFERHEEAAERSNLEREREKSRQMLLSMRDQLEEGADYKAPMVANGFFYDVLVLRGADLAVLVESTL